MLLKLFADHVVVLLWFCADRQKAWLDGYVISQNNVIPFRRRAKLPLVLIDIYTVLSSITVGYFFIIMLPFVGPCWLHISYYSSTSTKRLNYKHTSLSVKWFGTSCKPSERNTINASLSLIFITRHTSFLKVIFEMYGEIVIVGVQKWCSMQNRSLQIVQFMWHEGNSSLLFNKCTQTMPSSQSGCFFLCKRRESTSDGVKLRADRDDVKINYWKFFWGHVEQIEFSIHLGRHFSAVSIATRCANCIFVWPANLITWYPAHWNNHSSTYL